MDRKDMIMRILVSNDDGIHCGHLIKLVELAKELVDEEGEVWVIAPAEECSAMSHRVTVHGDFRLKKEVDFPVEGVYAYSLNGTPADCVKVGIQCVLPEKPDVVLSGMNIGYNISRDVVYSGTVGAAAEGAMNGVLSIAYSLAKGADFGVPETYFLDLTRLLLRQKLASDEIWNVNFPGCPAKEVKGILFNRTLAPKEYYFGHYEKEEISETESRIVPVYEYAVEGTPGSDMEAVINGYISVARVKNMVP